MRQCLESQMNLKAVSGNCHKLISRTLLLFVVSQIVIGQDCLRPAAREGRQIPFVDRQDLPRLPRDTLALIPDYQFHCCGNITNWRAFVAPRNDITYALTLQVWRPVPGSPNCLTLVGTIPLEESENQVSVLPGDVVGYTQSVTSDEDPSPNGEGIILDTSFDDVSVWYQTGSNFLSQATSSSLCIPENGGNGILNSVITAAPAISVELSTFSCLSPTATDQNVLISKSASTFTSSSLEQTNTDLEVVTSRSISTNTSPPPPPSEKNLKLLSLLMVLAVIVVMVVTLGGVTVLHRRKRAKMKPDDGKDIGSASNTTATSYNKEYLSSPHEKGLEMVDNTAYAHNISTTANKCYATPYNIQMSCERFHMKDNTAYIHSHNSISTVVNESYVVTNIAMSANPAYSKTMLNDTETSILEEAEYSYPRIDTNRTVAIQKKDHTINQS